MMSLRLSIAVIMLPLAACGQTAETPSASGTETALAPESSASAAGDPTLPPSQRVMLAADGIVYRSEDKGSVLKVRFGDVEQDATGQLVTITSESTEYFDANTAGCSTTTFGASAGYFQSGKFVGYATSDTNLKTAQGIGIGSSRAAVTAAFDPEFKTLSEGTIQFASATMHGILQGEGESAKVVVLGAGTACDE